MVWVAGRHRSWWMERWTGFNIWWACRAAQTKKNIVDSTLSDKTKRHFIIKTRDKGLFTPNKKWTGNRSITLYCIELSKSLSESDIVFVHCKYTVRVHHPVANANTEGLLTPSESESEIFLWCTNFFFGLFLWSFSLSCSLSFRQFPLKL